ncbi:MAG: sigma-54 dependent transcriptional regulator, partial [Planctomycetia bacterium]|nr:sigma-54 dependent transcriptional regulator [Planctomycetia bacterium]
MIRILIVDNERPHAEIVSMALARVGYETEIAVSGEEAVERLGREYFDVIFTDLIMDGIDGFGVLQSARENLPDAAVIIMTGHGSVPSAVSAMQQGAFNYLLKPLDLKQLRAVAEKAAESATLKRVNIELQTRLDEKFGFEKLIGNSLEMRELVEKLRRIAPTNATVLIQGATGTGKELVAQAIHQNSPRKNKPFVGLNCAALSENILESELFGHVKGAFTDATSDRVGKIEYANGGTLFLDEVGDMPLATQIKLLRVLEENEITRVGANNPIPVNIRLLSATNRDLQSAIEQGTFRSDLYHRLKVVTLRIPTLSQRSGDIPVLIDHFLRVFAQKHQKPIRGMTPAARKCFLQYDFPGNVRELRNLVESMVVVDYDGLLDIDDLPEELGLLVPPEEREHFLVSHASNISEPAVSAAPVSEST